MHENVIKIISTKLLGRFHRENVEIILNLNLLPFTLW